ncbi:TetR family transcriptional regulator [Cellulomonas sp. HZM]|uniref:TetR family transcriptional regulator n=1 Tax=Cellulomonas sp. HZM TaxID=1454010 RepID=UPI0004935854|nr:TetR family transcriptional regulator [Cellulomonas sp. HZM]
MAIDTEQILDAALDLLREGGLDAVTVRALTTRLGVQAPAVYWRFAGKRELLDAVAESVLAERVPGLPPFDGVQPWAPWWADRLRALRAAMLAYPDGARLVTGATPLRVPTLERLVDDGLAAAEVAGLDLLDAAVRVYTSLHYTFGHVIEEQDSAAVGRMDDETAASFHERYPAVARLLALAVSSGATPDDAFDAGLHLILR